MKCSNPITGSKVSHGTRFTYQHRCGQCMSCRIHQRQEWAGRILLEAGVHPHNSFITLTYAPEFLPEGGNLDPDELTNFIKRLRKIYYEKHKQTLRYFAVGEYGDRFRRAHYHAVLFNFPATSQTEAYVRKAWSRCVNRRTGEHESLGYVKVSPLTPQRAVYCARYTTKKLSEEKRTDGLVPEFARMSQKPGLGYQAAFQFINAFARYSIAVPGSSEANNDYVINTRGVFRLHGKFWPIPRYIKQKLAVHFGENELPREGETYSDWLSRCRRADIRGDVATDIRTKVKRRNTSRYFQELEQSEAKAARIIRLDRIRNGSPQN